MIYDKLDNIELYKGNSNDIYAGLQYLRDTDADIAAGTYQINPRVKAIVSEYETKIENTYGFEAHRKNIDIQYLIIGEEKINCLPLEYLKESKAYDEEIDAAFYVERGIKSQELLLGNGYFAILFPQDGHMPQLCVNTPRIVKKVVVKVKIGE
jgi:YhcH/YjgK/YiaL family protein